MPVATNSILAGNLLTAGLRADFWDTYHTETPVVEADLADVVNQNIPSDKIEEFYAYLESSPYPARWDRGAGIPTKAMRSVGFSVVNFDWARRVPWHVNDRNDDQTKSLFEMAQGAGRNWASLDERLFFQVITGAADIELLPSIPLAPDGVALYSTVAGGSARFGKTSGNLLTGSTVDSAQDIKTDYYQMLQQFKGFQDTEGQPLWNSRILDQGVIVYFNSDNWEVYQEAFIRARTVEVVQNVAGTENVAAAAPTNVIMASGITVKLRPTQRITDDSAYYFMIGSPKKAVFTQEREPVFETVATWENSDHTRNTQEEYIQWKSRKGVGVGVPYQTIKISN